MTPHDSAVTWFDPVGAVSAAHPASLQRAVELNERILAGTRVTALTALDAWDTVLETLIDFQKRHSGRVAPQWLADQIDAQAALVRNVNGAWTRAVRAGLA